MFEYAYGAVPQIAYQRSPQSLLLSVLLHATAVLALFAVRFSPVAPNPAAAPRHVVLIAPPLSPPPALIRPRFTPLVRVVSHIAPRSFRAPPAPPAPVPPKIALEVPPVPPAITPINDTAHPLLAAPELTRIPVPPAPPLKTNNLVATPPDIPAPAPKLTIQSAGFSGVAEETERRNPATAVLKGGFTDASVAAAVRPVRAAPVVTPSALTPVEILFKPRPLYSPEARRLKIEGEVLVELLFAASGEARVLRIVRGLGHGLDEMPSPPPRPSVSARPSAARCRPIRPPLCTSSFSWLIEGTFS